MLEFIGSADIYITPYKNEAQVVSGTLAYALGAGKAVISTPYWHAQELLDQRRGVLVPFNDQEAIAEQTINSWRMKPSGTRCANARIYTHATWCGKASPRTICAASSGPERSACGTLVWPAQIAVAPDEIHGLPAVKLNHLSRMTDETGMLQHAVFAIPNHHEGYTTDDNARALIVSILVQQLGTSGRC